MKIDTLSIASTNPVIKEWFEWKYARVAQSIKQKKTQKK